MLLDAIIVGGSFAGLSAAMQLGRARKTVLVIDSGRPRNRFSDASHGFFGRDGASPVAMISEAQRQVGAYPSVQFAGGEAVRASREDAAFAVTLGDGTIARSRKLVLAFGVQDVLPDLPGLRERWGRTVLHCPYCHGYELDQAPLGVLTLGPLSAHQALLIADWGPVTLFTDGRDDLDADMRAKLARRLVAIETARVVALEGELPALAGVRLADGRLVPVVALFIAAPTRMGSTMPEQLGCAFEDGLVGPMLVTDATKQTTVAGVYAAGDVALPGSNVALAVSDGAMAAVHLHRALVAETAAG